jgi:hypothetical protein
VQPPKDPRHQLSHWTAETIGSECDHAYGRYKVGVHRRSPTRPFAASSRRAAFPDGYKHLADLIPDSAWHEFHLFGGSSQTLAIALLSAAHDAEPSLSWLPRFDTLGSAAAPLFEVELASHVLNEYPRQTALDWLVVGQRGLIVAEAKFTERGFGACNCVEKASGQCAGRILDRPYWNVASRVLGLDRDEGSRSCVLSIAYQALETLPLRKRSPEPIEQRRFCYFTIRGTPTSPGPVTGPVGFRSFRPSGHTHRYGSPLSLGKSCCRA